MKRHRWLGYSVLLGGVAMWLSVVLNDPPAHPNPVSPSSASALPNPSDPQRPAASGRIRSDRVPARNSLVGTASGASTASVVGDRLAPSMLAAIHALEADKALRTPVQRKIDSQLLFADKMHRGVPIADGIEAVQVRVEEDPRGRVKVDMKGHVTPGLLRAIGAAQGEVLDAHEGYDAIRAWVAWGALEALAARPDVAFIQPAARAMTHVGSVTSQGVVTHRADVAASQFKATGKGVKVGVLSDSIDALAHAQSKGDLGPVVVLTNRLGRIQDGLPGSGEGTAMLEVIHDMAPDAQLFFASGLNGEASFAQNIRDLRFRLGCDVIVDDVEYFRESPFQDGIIAQAVEAVVADGAVYLSAAGNAGNQSHGTSGTWEGDFVDSGESTASGGSVHRFPSGSFNSVVPGGSLERVDLFWSDPLGGSSNDYDVYVFDESNALVASANNFQTGNQDPYESIARVSPGQRIVVVRQSGAARFLHLETGRGRLFDFTDGRIRGHAAAEGALAVAAVDVANVGAASPFVSGAKCPVQPTSSDGPRRMFYRADGAPLTPGQPSGQGGVVRQKPDIAAADGVRTTFPEGTSLNPFFGTSSAASHAAGMAALIKSINPGLAPVEVRSVLVASALDNAATGIDRDSGHGIIMADAAARVAGAPVMSLIARFDPPAGMMGQRIQVEGTKLGSVTQVLFNGTPAAFSISSQGALLAVVPLGATSGPIAIVTPSGRSETTEAFRVVEQPVLWSATPSMGASGMAVRLRGAYLEGTTNVRFSGSNAAFTQPSADELIAIVPANAASGRITVTTPRGSATNAELFSIVTRPVLAGFSPDAGVSGTRVVVTGANLGTLTGAQFNQRPANFVVESPNQVAMTVPSGASSGRITLTSPQGKAESTFDFVVLSMPVITGVSPASGAVGDPVRVSGSNLLSVTTLAFNGKAAEFFPVAEGTLVAVVPFDALTGPLAITSPAGATTSAVPFTVVMALPNDASASAEVLVGPSGSAKGSNIGATKEAGEPAHAANKGGRSVWYQWTAPSDGVWRVDTLGSGFDTLLGVYVGSGPATWTPIASNDNASAGTSGSSVLFPATEGVTYLFAIDGFNPGDGPAFEASSGAITLNWSVEALVPQVTTLSSYRAKAGEAVTLTGLNLDRDPAVAFNGVPVVVREASARRIEVVVPEGLVNGPVTVTTAGGTATAPMPFRLARPPANDSFAQAQALEGPEGSIDVNTRDASMESGEPRHAVTAGGRSVWFRWIAPGSGLFRFDTEDGTFDTVLAAYSGTSLASLTPVASNDDAGALLTSRIVVQAEAGTSYFIAVDGDASASGTATLTWAEIGEKPIIADFSPLDGGVQSWVTVTGANFTNVASVQVGPVIVTDYAIDSLQQIRLRIPALATNGAISITTAAGVARGPGVLRVTDAPGNDRFDARQAIVGTRVVLPFANRKAGFEVGEPLHASVAGGKSLWFEWKVPTQGTWAIDTAGSSFDTTLAVYSGTNLANLTVVAANDDFGTHRFSRVEFQANANAVLVVAVDGVNGASGDGFLRILPRIREVVAFETGFETAQGFDPARPLGGQQGWTATNPSGNGLTTNLFPGSTQGAYVGMQGSGCEVRVPLSIVTDATRPVVRFDLDLAVHDSTNAMYDNFRLRFYNRAGQRLLVINLNNRDHTLYHVDGSDLFPTWPWPVTFNNAQPYRLSVVMNVASNRWSAFLDGQRVVSEALITESGRKLDVAALGVAWVPANPVRPGNNFLALDNLKVAVSPPGAPLVSSLAPAPATTAGLPPFFAVVADGMPPFQYQWLRNGVAIPGADEPVLRLGPASLADSGTYSVRITNAQGTVTSAGVPLAVFPLEFSLEPSGILRVKCAPNQRVRIEVSPDLVEWTPWVTQSANADGILRAPMNVEADSQGFYRVIIE